MPDARGRFPSRPPRSPDVQDDFPGPVLDDSLWVDHYLPHWTTPERSRARYDVTQGLHVRIEADQPVWRPEDAPLRVSSVQTGTASGARGTTTGIHRHRPDGMIVRTETPFRTGWAPAAGRVEIALSPAPVPGFVTAAWLVGTETRSPDDSGEICLVELETSAHVAGAGVARTGIKAHGDPRLTTEMIDLPADPRHLLPSTWSAQWDASGTVIGRDGEIVFRSVQAPAYPKILLVGLFEVAPSRTADAYPVGATVHSVRGWSL